MMSLAFSVLNSKVTRSLASLSPWVPNRLLITLCLHTLLTPTLSDGSWLHSASSDAARTQGCLSPGRHPQPAQFGLINSNYIYMTMTDDF